jgi:hypothetical protein
MWRAPATGGQVEVFSVSRGLQPSTSFFACDRPGIDRGRLVFPAPATSSAGCGQDSVMGTVNLHGPVVEIDVPVHPDVFGPQLVFSEDGSAYVWPAGNGAVRGSDGGALGCGYVHAIAGADDGTVALATDIGVVIATATPDGGRGVGVFDVPAQQVDISGDGRTVAATAPGVAWTFSVPSTSLLHTWGKLTTLPAAADVDVVRGFSMARSGDHVAVSFLKSGGMTLNPEYEIRLTDPGEKGKVSTLPAADPAVLLSPTGAYLIATDETGHLVIDEGTKLRATPPNMPTAWWDDRVYVARSPDGAGGWLPAEARDVDGGVVPGLTIASENVDGYGANNVQVLGVSYFPPVIPYANGLNYSQPAHQILDRATGAVVVDAPAGMIAGPVVITQTATLLVGRPLP